ncbi:hypothetical protein HC592_23950, partial [Escherichia coli]|nr:hypothetical protein [Escherichia coli]
MQHKVTRDEWKLKPEQFRRCSSRETLEKVITRTRYKLTPAELEAFNSAVDHRLAELNRPGFPGECFICELRL